MSRSKNFYQGMSLGRVQRSEYDDAKMRDLARHDARLGESLKTVERAKNVMKKSMEADKQLFIKTGYITSVKTSVPAQGIHARSSPKTVNQFVKLGSEPRIKRFSVTDMPSDLARSTHNSGKVLPRPISFHELSNESTNTCPVLGKEYGSFDKLSESNMSHMGSLKSSLPNKHSEIVTTPRTLERYSEHDSSLTSDGDHRGLHSMNRSTTEPSKYQKSLSRADPDKTNESRTRHKQSSNGLADEVVGKSDDMAGENVGEIKNQGHEQGPAHKQDTQSRFRKRSTLWETLSTPKHTSLTKSKRNQIEMEFTRSGMTSCKSSPALFSVANVKPPIGGQRRPPLPRSGNVQVRQIDGSKEKQSTFSRS